MAKYIMRLDDASEKMDVIRWSKMEKILDKYNVKPLVGVIPYCKDQMMEKYEKDPHFWKKIKGWENKGWIIALHGYDHVYCTNNPGINPRHHRSEFAGLSLVEQEEKIEKGIAVFDKNKINPKVFFAPSHTFDTNTIEALKSKSEIRIISDTISNKSYRKYGITFVPQQSGKVRKLPFDTVTFCYHPNLMEDPEFNELERFLSDYSESFVGFFDAVIDRNPSIIDWIVKILYQLRNIAKKGVNFL